MSSLPALALPGQPLGGAASYAPGPGIHIQDQQLYASLLGPVSATKPPKRPSAAGPSSSMPALSIARPDAHAAVGASAATNTLPEVDAVVLARVTRLTPRQATVEILVVGEAVCREGFQGIIRREDVRATEKDRVKIGDMFRVGDIVRGVVVSFSLAGLAGALGRSLGADMRCSRFRWVTSRIITSRPQRMSWAS